MYNLRIKRLKLSFLPLKITELKFLVDRVVLLSITSKIVKSTFDRYLALSPERFSSDLGWWPRMGLRRNLTTSARPRGRQRGIKITNFGLKNFL